MSVFVLNESKENFRRRTCYNEIREQFYKEKSNKNKRILLFVSLKVTPLNRLNFFFNIPSYLRQI